MWTDGQVSIVVVGPFSVLNICWSNNRLGLLGHKLFTLCKAIVFQQIRCDSVEGEYYGGRVSLANQQFYGQTG